MEIASKENAPPWAPPPRISFSTSVPSRRFRSFKGKQEQKVVDEVASEQELPREVSALQTNTNSKEELPTEVSAIKTSSNGELPMDVVEISPMETEDLSKDVELTPVEREYPADLGEVSLIVTTGAKGDSGAASVTDAKQVADDYELEEGELAPDEYDALTLDSSGMGERDPSAADKQEPTASQFPPIFHVLRGPLFELFAPEPDVQPTGSGNPSTGTKRKRRRKNKEKKEAPDAKKQKCSENSVQVKKPSLSVDNVADSKLNNVGDATPMTASEPAEAKLVNTAEAAGAKATTKTEDLPLTAMVKKELGLDILDEWAEEAAKSKKRVLTAARKQKKKANERIKRAEKERQMGITRRRPIYKQIEKPLEICRYFLKGRCNKGVDCTFSHDTTPETKSNLCKYFLTGHCLKGDDCPFSHEPSKFPCKYLITRGFCKDGDNCRFSHQPVSEEEREKIVKRVQTEAERKKYEAKVYEEPIVKFPGQGAEVRDKDVYDPNIVNANDDDDGDDVSYDPDFPIRRESGADNYDPDFPVKRENGYYEPGFPVKRESGDYEPDFPVTVAGYNPEGVQVVQEADHAMGDDSFRWMREMEARAEARFNSSRNQDGSSSLTPSRSIMDLLQETIRDAEEANHL